MNEFLENCIDVLNGALVGVFGMILSAAFGDIRWTKRKKIILTAGMAGLFLWQGTVYYLMGSETVRFVYPVMVHIPLAIILCAVSKRYLWSVISVFTAYLCCQIRRWLALFVVAIVSGDSMMQNLVEAAVTIPLLLLLLRYAAPAVRMISTYPVSMQYQFGLVPVVAYCFDYLTQTYTNLYSKGSPVVTEFMSFVCSAAYLVFVLRASREQQIRRQLETAQENLNLQVAQAVREIEHLRQSQQQASTYRHDLRHHMQYLLACMENNQSEKAQAYIHEICSEIEANRVINYCENEAANLIFSSFSGRVEALDIAIKIRAAIPSEIPVSEMDLCVLLSNALENALHACQKVRGKGLPADIDVMVYEKNGKLFFQITNSCTDEVTLKNGVPVTDRPGHGIGVRSILMLVERYGGIYAFELENGRFILRISL